MRIGNRYSGKIGLGRVRSGGLTLVVATVGVLLTLTSGDAQRKPQFKIPEGATELDRMPLPRDKDSEHPIWFKVYSKDASERMQGVCDLKDSIDNFQKVPEITCSIAHVRFIPPEKKSGLEGLTEFDMTHPQVVEELRRNPKRSKQLWNEIWTKNAKQHVEEECETRAKVAYERTLRDPGIGPKRKKYLQDLLSACSKNDATQVVKLTEEFKRRTCSVSVNNFTLEFKKVSPGQWLNTRTGKDAVTIYELIAKHGETVVEKVIEKIIPLGNKKTNLPRENIWTDENTGGYELPCDYIDDNVWAPEPRTR